jgi:hypothetical protein
MLIFVTLLLHRAVVVATGDAPTCLFRLASSVFDLSPFRGASLVGRDDQGSVVHTSLCGDLPLPCVDPLSGSRVYGSTMLYLPSGAACWDTIAQWSLFPPAAAPLSRGGAGLRLLFERPGDAHLDCAVVRVNVSVFCDADAPSAPAAARVAGTQRGCEWDFAVRSGASAVCAPAPVPAAPAPLCNASAFNVSLRGLQCFGLEERSGPTTVAACVAAACAAGAQMWEFCPPGSTCDGYVGPSCWVGSVGLKNCKPSAAGWAGASQAAPPPPAPTPPPPPQRWAPPSRATAPIAAIDLADERGEGGAWTLAVDGRARRAIRVPMGGYSSDFQPPPYIDQGEVATSVIYARAFAAPAPRAGSVLHLAFGAVNHGARVYINGVEVGAHLGPMMAFEVDVTAALAGVAPGAPVSLAVEAFPYQALAGLVPSSFMYAEAWRNDTSGWMSRSCAGICRYVRLVELPAVRVAAVATAARVGPPAALAVRVTIVNDGAAPLPSLSFTAALSSWNGAPWAYPAIPPQAAPGGVPAGGAVTVRFDVPWDGVGPESWWWPNRPYDSAYLAQLHFLNVTLSTGAASSTRFGFVEHAEAGGYYYTLNGVRVNHISDATPENGMSYYDAYSFSGGYFSTNPRDVWRAYMRAGVTSNRIHQSTPTEAMLAAADEVGFLLKPESPVRGGCNYAACPRPLDLSVFAQSVAELADACRGHPSVFSYSVENESAEVEDGQPLIAALIDAAAGADPTVPLTTEGSGGAARYNGTLSSAVNFLHYAVPDHTRTHIRAVGESAWCVDAGLEMFASLTAAGRLDDVVYYAGWDWLVSAFPAPAPRQNRALP